MSGCNLANRSIIRREKEHNAFVRDFTLTMYTMERNQPKEINLKEPPAGHFFPEVPYLQLSPYPLSSGMSEPVLSSRYRYGTVPWLEMAP